MHARKRSSSPVGIATRHDQYYLRDGNIFLRVEDHLYCIHRHFLTRDSPVFQSILSQSTAGSKAETAIVIPHVKSDDFCNLLWMFYNEWVESDCRQSSSSHAFDHRSYEYVASPEKWISILAMAERFQMATVRNACVRALSRCNLKPLDKLIICARFGIERSWAVDAYVTLALRRESVTPIEARAIGADTLVVIADVRERICARRLYFMYNGPKDHDELVEKEALSFVRDAIKRLEVEESTSFVSREERIKRRRTMSPERIPT